MWQLWALATASAGLAGVRERDRTVDQLSSLIELAQGGKQLREAKMTLF